MRRFILNLFGRPKTSVISFSLVTAILFLLVVGKYSNYITIVTIYNYYNSDIANISGVLAGFIFSAFGLIGLANNRILSILNTTENIKVINKVLLSSILYFAITIVIYFLKPLFIFDINNISYFSFVQEKAIFCVLLIGLYCFTTGFVLFIFTIFILKKLICK